MTDCIRQRQTSQSDTSGGQNVGVRGGVVIIQTSGKNCNRSSEYFVLQ
jgi:hypothetical protein